MSIQVDIVDGTGDGSWTAPPGVTFITIYCFGGGGGGGYRDSASGRTGGGGGGECAKKTFVVAPGTRYNLFVGSGGDGRGSDATASWFQDADRNTICQGNPGTKGTANSTTGGAGGSKGKGDVLYTGGAGADGGTIPSGPGGGGGGAGTFQIGDAGGTQSFPPLYDERMSGGVGGADYGGNGGTAVDTANQNGADALTNGYGGGGSGCRRTAGTIIGGRGRQGAVIITYATNVIRTVIGCV